MTRRLDRRRLLVGAAALLAGCGTAPETDDDTDAPGGNGATQTTDAGADSPGTTTAGTTATDGGTGSTSTDGGTGNTSTDVEGETPTPTATPAGELDLREANVTAVEVSASGDDHRFDVTLYHDDDGEDGYANWWQVETLDGEQLGRRELLHAHGTREFTRSDTFSLPDVDCVVVRGHDQTHGYGGQAMLVSLADGATRAVRQGSEPRSFADADCP